MLGETTYQPFAINTFSGRGRQFTTLTPVHYVTPHKVRAHRRNGVYISETWRDGDGDPTVNRSTGYFAKNPGSTPIIIPGVIKR